MTTKYLSTPWWQGELLLGDLGSRYAFVHWCVIPDRLARVYGRLDSRYFGISWRRFHAEVSW